MASFNDSASLGSEREFTDEGYLIVPARIARTGVYEYLASELGLLDRDPLELVKVYRDEAEVFQESSLKSFARKPVTNNHPDQLVSARTAKEFSVGMSDREVFREGDYVKTFLTITDAEAIDQIKNGKVEVSNGYTADVELKNGITDSGEKFDAIQKNIKGNHIALVSQGRAGSSCRLSDHKKEAKSMTKKVIIDSVEYETTEQVAQAVGKVQNDFATASAEIETLNKLVSDQKSSIDRLQAELDDTKTKVLSRDQIDSLVSSRSELIATAKRISPELLIDGKTDFEIKKAVVSDNCNTDLTGKSDEYINARFDHLVESFKPTDLMDGEFTKMASSSNQSTADSRPAHEIAREKFVIEQRGGNA